MAGVFTRIEKVEVPAGLVASPKAPEATIRFWADGDIPFPQVVIRKEGDGGEILLRSDAISPKGNGEYEALVKDGVLSPGRYFLQVEGCRRADIENARGEDWIKTHAELHVGSAPASVPAAAPRIEASSHPTGSAKLFFGIHKHMHQPYYRAADPDFWDGMCDSIFSERAGAYRSFVPMAVHQYESLPHAGLSMSWSGSLVEQLDRASALGRCGGAYAGDWKAGLRSAANLRTVGGFPRGRFSAFGFFHPLMPLIPGRDIERQILMHREMVRGAFGVDASRILFPPETAFHVRMIPSLLKAGIEAVIYDSIHRYRACRDYPYAGPPEGMLPPNAAEQENPPVSDWLQLRNVWAGSKIAPSLLKPEYVKYEDVDGSVHKIIAVPAERYIGNEDARGGFGALVYPDVLGQVLDAVEKSGSYDPAHPPFFLLHSDGDNYGGGTDSYYGANTGRMVEWLRFDPRFELTTIEDYLTRFPPDPEQAVHIEPGSWSGADNGDPQFMKWFSRYREEYSPDLHSWAVLTALENAVHTILDAGGGDAVQKAERLMLTAQTSCYWYWTGQDIWDRQVTDAANAALSIIRSELDSLVSGGRDRTGPTIFPPWVIPENPGGKTWGNNCLRDAEREGTVHTFIYDVSGIKSARLVLRPDAGRGEAEDVPLEDKGPYPTQFGALATARQYTAVLPVGKGDVRYWIECEDERGNLSRSSLERVYLA